MALHLEQDDDRDVRVADYLDDKLQTAADLDSLDTLLDGIQNSYGLLRQQLDEAARELDEAKDASRKQAVALQQQVDDFHARDDDIRRRLQILGLSETSDDAVPPIEAVWKKLDRLDETAGFIKLLQEIDRLSEECRSSLQSPDGDALEPYRQLQSLATQLEPLSVAADYAAPNLLNEVKKTVKDVYGQIKQAYASELEVVLKSISWPKPNAILPGNLQAQWDAAVGNLLDLQLPDLLANERARSKVSATPPLVLLPLDVLVQPLEMRFRYHFDGDRPTNRLDKPEYFLSHVLSLLNSYVEFVIDTVQPVISSHFRTTDLAFSAVYIDATSALITALLPMVKKKIFSVLPQVAKQPQLLSHTMQEIMNFDTTIREEWRYDGGFGMQGWNGLAWEVLSTDGWFEKYLQNEKNFALSRYRDIIETPDSGEIDYESVPANTTKPTKAAIRVNDLLETITERYKPLSSFSQKLRFLMDIQIAIFDSYYERLYNGLEAFLALTSTIGRTMPGVVASEQTEVHGVHGLDRLCRIYGSSDYLERAMRDWSDDVFFLEMWEELQFRANKNGQSDSVLSGQHPRHTISDLASRTSSNLGDQSASGGALFDETASAYSRLRSRAEERLIEHLQWQSKDAIRAYSRTNLWSSIPASSSTPSGISQLPPSAELDSLLRFLNESFTFLKKALAPVPLRRVARAVLKEVQTDIWSGVLMRHSFSTNGAAQLSADVQAICRVINSLVGPGVGESGMLKLLEGVKLVGLPVKGSARSKAQTSSEDDESAADAWGHEESEAQTKDDAAPATANDDDGVDLGLWDVEKKLFADNESARDILEQLGMSLLSENEARQVLGRRVELAS